MALSILITGAEGQLGSELRRTAPSAMAVHALESTDLDITDKSAVDEAFTRLKPDVLINAAAYTAVDHAENETEKAYAVNERGTEILATAAARAHTRLLHVSTDFIFGGSQGHPYGPTDAAHPLSVYGASKLAGEQRLQTRNDLDWLILRTSWLYSAHGGGNFVKTVLRLMGQGKPLRVVSDQVGTPTWARGLAEALWIALDKGLSGIHHWSDAGVASWYDFAVAIQEEALAIGLLEKPTPIAPVTTPEYETLAQRPSYSVLDKSATWRELDLVPPQWRVNLRLMLAEMKSQPAAT